MQLCRAGIARAFSANTMLTKVHLNKMRIETCMFTKLHRKYIAHCKYHCYITLAKTFRLEFPCKGQIWQK